MTICLITGGAGFIGSHLARALISDQAQVRILDNFSSGRADNLAGLPVELVPGDIRDLELLLKLCEGVDTVFHLAAQVSAAASMEDPQGTYDANTLGSLNVLWAAYTANVRRVVLASSAAVYGEAESVVDEQAPQFPMSPYAGSKQAMEQAAALFTRAYNLPTVALRFFNVYGPKQSPDSPYAAAIPTFIKRMMAGEAPLIHGDGQQSRDFVFVVDAVRALKLAAAYDGAVGDVFNVGAGRSITILELVRTLQPLFPEAPPAVHVDPRPGDIRFSEAKIDRIWAALKYRPEIDLQKGLEITVQWFLARETNTNE